MAIFEYADRKYVRHTDLQNLLTYITNPSKCIATASNMLYSDDLDLVIKQWLYYHVSYCKLNMNQGLAFHYILSFDPTKQNILYDTSTIISIMNEISQLYLFQGNNLFMGLHNQLGKPLHIHIVCDTINKVTGNNTFIPRDSFIQTFGLLLAHYNIPLYGYSPIQYCFLFKSNTNTEVSV